MSFIGPVMLIVNSFTVLSETNVQRSKVAKIALQVKDKVYDIQVKISVRN